MRIVVTNDDGIYSPGLLTLARAAQVFGQVRIVAPDVEMTIRHEVHHAAVRAGRQKQ